MPAYIDPAWEYWVPEDPELVEFLQEFGYQVDRSSFDCLTSLRDEDRADDSRRSVGFRYGRGNPNQLPHLKLGREKKHGGARRSLPDRVCPTCGSSYRPKQSSQVYCRRACVPRVGGFGKPKTLPSSRVCPDCGTEFQPLYSGHTYCGRECGLRHGGAVVTSDYDAIVRSYRDTGSVAETAKKTGHSKTTCLRALGKAGIKLGPAGCEPRYFITHNGRRQSLVAWAEELDLKPATVLRRFRQNPNGSSAELLAKSLRKDAVVSHCGKTQTLAQWAKELGIKQATLQARYAKSKDPEVLFRPTERKMPRDKMPDRRPNWCQTARIGGQRFYLTCGEYPPDHQKAGQPGEVWIDAAKMGSFLRGILDTLARQISIALQSGTGVKEVIKGLRSMNFPPNGAVKAEMTDVTICTSVADWVAQELEIVYVKGNRKRGTSHGFEGSLAGDPARQDVRPDGGRGAQDDGEGTDREQADRPAPLHGDVEREDEAGDDGEVLPV